MTLSALETHLYRLEDVRGEIVGQGDAPPADLEDRLQQVRALIAEVRVRIERRTRERFGAAHRSEPLAPELDTRA